MTLTEEETTQKYDSDRHEVAYEEAEVVQAEHRESLVIQRVLNVVVSKSLDDDSWLRKEKFVIFHTNSPSIPPKEKFVT